MARVPDVSIVAKKIRNVNYNPVTGKKTHGAAKLCPCCQTETGAGRRKCFSIISENIAAFYKLD